MRARRKHIPDELDAFMEVEQKLSPTQTEITAPPPATLNVAEVHKEESVRIIAPDADMPIPEEWPNGSAVLRPNAEPHGWPICKAYEQVNGFLGRTVNMNGMLHVWAWTGDGYTYRGATDDVPTSFKLLEDIRAKGEKVKQPSSAGTRQKAR